uniref:Uncharacterized protein n=1 Tax=Glossina pallidipes TaxID=7398 RepID=A0A1A9ZCH4_GLOPL
MVAFLASVRKFFSYINYIEIILYWHNSDGNDVTIEDGFIENLVPTELCNWQLTTVLPIKQLLAVHEIGALLCKNSDNGSAIESRKQHLVNTGSSSVQFPFRGHVGICKALFINLNNNQRRNETTVKATTISKTTITAANIYKALESWQRKAAVYGTSTILEDYIDFRNDVNLVTATPRNDFGVMCGGGSQIIANCISGTFQGYI